MSISITLNGQKKHEVSPHLYGIFYEDINFSCDGGINANMVMNYSFEGVFLDRKTEQRVIDPLRGWTFTGKEITSETEDPLNVNSRYARLAVDGEAELTNLGFNGDKAYADKGAMSILPGNTYLFECWLRRIDFSGIIPEHQGKGIASSYSYHHPVDRVNRSDLVFVVIIVNDLNRNLCVRITVELISVPEQLCLQLLIVFDDPVVHSDHICS